MNRYGQLEDRQTKSNSGKPVIFIVVFLLFAAVIVLSGIFMLRSYFDLDTLRLYVQEIPVIVDSFKTEFETQKHVYESDALTRGELGLKLYQSDLKPSDTKGLEWVRDMSSAESVSVVDKNGNISETTGPVIPEERLKDRIPSIEPRTPFVEVYFPDDGDGKVSEGSVLVMIPVPGENGQSLLFEFSCEPLLKLNDELYFPENFSEMFPENTVYAFFMDDIGQLSVCPEDAFNDQEKSKLNDELEEILASRLASGETKYTGVMRLMGKFYLTICHSYPEDNMNLVMAMPMMVFIGKSLLSAIVLFGFIAANIIIFYIYARRITRNEKAKGDKDEFRRRVRMKTMPGFFMMLAAIVCFTVLYLMLEKRSIIARNTIDKRAALQYEISWHDRQKEEVLNVCSKLYRTRVEVAAKLLKEPGYRTKKGLKELSDITQTEYLMLFDKDGQEIVSSNSYTGFSVTGENANLGEEYRAMLLGYPSVIVGPELDNYSGKTQINVAVLLKKDDGTADGFLLAAFGTDEIEAVLVNESLESTVLQFPVSDLCKAAVAKIEGGVFIAHSDIEMIGHEAAEVLDESVLNGNYEGFTEYDRKSAYVSSFQAGENTLLMIHFEQTNKEILGIVILLIIALVALVLIEYLHIYKVCGNLTESSGNQVVSSGETSTGILTTSSDESVLIFLHGYALYFTLVAAAIYVMAVMRASTSFAFVFERQWSPGVHMFSLWAALFIISITFCIVIVLRGALARLDNSVSPRGRTIIKMMDHVICYLVGFFLIIFLLYLFGVQSVVLAAAVSSIAMAFGFGARNITSDFIVGAFIILEDSLHVGDKVKIDQSIGYITNMNLRTVEITDEEHKLITVNNSAASRIVNLSNSTAGSSETAGDDKDSSETAGDDKDKNETAGDNRNDKDSSETAGDNRNDKDRNDTIS